MSSDLPLLGEEGAASGWDLQAAVLPSAASAAGSAVPPLAGEAVVVVPWAVFPAPSPASQVRCNVSVFVPIAALCRGGRFFLPCRIPS